MNEITVKELIEILSGYPQDLVIMHDQNASGDYEPLGSDYIRESKLYKWLYLN